ncbi:hypothetical protein LB941_09895 [Ligilactobacillus sp. WILCCON 0076]|uniref:Uncharacterized protein n=1 Tax=Ligilactobacillus ubinensis TaxID=2876789 RepID=A0A9X2FR63_9LACO|nr:hypothetical protein [Ligilactobacillus ubinensis]MCP0887643.1 hypothetical protein [Ligilactobacillus ubinensis]
MGYRYDTNHLTSQQKAIINANDENSKLLEKESKKEERYQKIMTTRQTGGLLQSYKPYVLASVSRRWLFISKSNCICHFCYRFKRYLNYLP